MNYQLIPLLLITSYIETTQMCRKGEATLFQSDILIFQGLAKSANGCAFDLLFAIIIVYCLLLASNYTCITQGPKTIMTKWYPT